MNREPTVFYSWQSDRPNGTNRGMISDAIEAALKAMKLKGKQSLRSDAATNDEPGTPNIPFAIFTKISSSAIFVGDVTIVQSRPTRGRKAPNPNVLIELGYAVRCLGWKRIILVMNAHFGGPELLPFHLQQHLFPLTYTFGPRSRDKAGTRSLLAKSLTAKIAQVVAAEHLQVERMLQGLDHHCAGFLYAAKEQNLPHFNGDGKDSAMIQRLLEVGVIYLNLGNNQKYAYEWTYLGGLVRDECHKRAQTATVPETQPAAGGAALASGGEARSK